MGATPAAPRLAAALLSLQLLAAGTAAQPTAGADGQQLPATFEELCASVPLEAPQLPAGFSLESLGPQQRLNTSTASWGYYR